MTVYIYMLSDPVTGQCRYIGKTKNPKSRMSMHVHDRNMHDYKARWVLGLFNRGLRPVMQIVETIENSDDLDWQAREVFWIKKKREEGCELTNLESGGRSGKNHSPETRRKISLANKGKVFSDETRKKMSEARMGIKLSDETKKKLSDINTGKTLPQEVKDKIGAAHKNRVFSPEHLAKISAALKGRLPSPACMEARLASVKGKKQTPEQIQKRVDAIKRARAINPYVCSEETKKKLSKAFSGRIMSTENRAINSAAQKIRRAREKDEREFDLAQRCVA